MLLCLLVLNYVHFLSFFIVTIEFGRSCAFENLSWWILFLKTDLIILPLWSKRFCQEKEYLLLQGKNASVCLRLIVTYWFNSRSSWLKFFRRIFNRSYHFTNFLKVHSWILCLVCFEILPEISQVTCYSAVKFLRQIQNT